MSKDKYSNAHTVEVYGDDQDLTLQTLGAQSEIDIKTTGGAGHINMTATGSGSYIQIQAGDLSDTVPSESLLSDVNIYAESDINIVADDDISLISDGYMLLQTRSAGAVPGVTLSMASGRNEDIVINAHDDIFIYADGQIILRSPNVSSIVTETGSAAVLDLINVGTPGSNQALFNIKNDSITKFAVDASGNFEALGKGTLADLRVTGATTGTTPATGKILTASNAFGDLQWSTMDAAVNWGNVSVEDNLVLEAPAGYVFIGSNDKIHLEADLAWGSTHLWCGYASAMGQVRIEGPSGTDSTLGSEGMGYPLFYIDVQSPNGAQIGARIDLSSSAGAEYTDISGSPVGHPQSRFIDFTRSGSLKGCIRPCPVRGDVIAGIFGATIWSDIGESGYSYAERGGSSSTGAVLSNWGDAQFVSGAADFGEFFEVGDISEWSKYNVNEESFLAGNGLPEGMVVWVHSCKFYKTKIDENSIPMIITKRAIMIGDANQVLDDDGVPVKAGEVLSFCGKLPVLIYGKAESGDYLIPDNLEGFCRAVSKKELTFDQYKDSIGRAIESREHTSILSNNHPHAPGQETSLGYVMTAIGIK